MSTTLSKLSGGAPANAAVAPVLAELLTSHRRYKDRAAVGFDKLGQLWQDVFGALLEGIVPALEAAADDALRRIEREGATIVGDLLVDALQRERALVREEERERIRREDGASLSGVKRKSSIGDLRAPMYVDDPSSDPPRGGAYHADDPRDKRRRIDSPTSMVVDRDDRARGRDLEAPRAVGAGGEGAPAPASSDVSRMLADMADMKAQMTALMKERDALKATLERSTPGAPPPPAVARAQPPPPPPPVVRTPSPGDHHHHHHHHQQQQHQQQQQQHRPRYAYEPRPPVPTSSYGSTSDFDSGRTARSGDPPRRTSLGGAGMHYPPPSSYGHHGGGRY